MSEGLQVDWNGHFADILKLLTEPRALAVLAQLAGTAAFCLWAPLIGDKYVPLSVRLATAGVLTGCAGYVNPGRGQTPDVIQAGMLPVVQMFAGSVANGLLVAFVLRTVWSVLGAGGHLAALSSGLGLAEALAPGTDVNQSGSGVAAGPVGLLVWVIGVGAFLASGADQILWQMALSCGSAGRTVALVSWSSSLTLAADLLTRAVLAGAILVGPALVAWALAEVTLGLAGRVYPLPDAWVMALPLRTGAGLFILAVTTGWMWRVAGPVWQRLLGQTGLAGGWSS